MTKWPNTCFIIGMVALLSGCAVGPDYVRPPADVPVSYKETEGWKVAEPKDHLIRGGWWETFNDPYLNSLEEQANLANQNIAVAEAQLRQARAVVRIAQAAYFPTAAIGASFNRSFNSPGGGGSGGGSTSTVGSSNTSRSSGAVSDYVLLGAVSWEPDLWGRIRRTVESSRASAQASAADLGATRLLVQAELAQDYFLLRTLDAQKRPNCIVRCRVVSRTGNAMVPIKAVQAKKTKLKASALTQIIGEARRGSPRACRISLGLTIPKADEIRPPSILRIR